jgi:hypothetical protein
MLSVEDAFRKFKSRLELNDKEQNNASSRHQEIRDHMRDHFDVENDFLTGSYRRHTKTKPLKDVDIFCVLSPGGRNYRQEHPSVVLKDFEKALAKKYGASAISRQRRSVTVDFGVVVDADDNTDYRVVSMDVIPAFAAGEDYEIPDATSGEWIKTNPKVHEEKATAAHKAYDMEWKGIVRMLKYWNNHNGKTIKPSFLLEVMCFGTLHPPFGNRFDYEFQGVFETLADRIYDSWGDPAELGPPVSDMMTAAEKTAANKALKQASRQCTSAIDLARQGRNGDALKAWRALFGPKFPLS